MALDRSEREALIDRYAEGPSRLKAALATRTGALTRPRTGSRSTRNISRSTPARSRTTWPRGGRRPVALLELPDLHVPAAEVRPQRDDASVFSLVVVQDAALGGKAE